MATIRKQGIDPHAEIRRHLGEDRSYGRATLRHSAPRKSGLNPLNTAAARDAVLTAREPVVSTFVVMSANCTRH